MQIYQFTLQMVCHPLKFTGLGLFYFGNGLLRRVSFPIYMYLSLYMYILYIFYQIKNYKLLCHIIGFIFFISFIFFSYCINIFIILFN